jgi:hypothetical protein
MSECPQMSNPATRWIRLIVGAVLCAVLAVGCTIEPDAVPRDVATEDRGLLLTDAAVGAAATGDGRIYLVSPSEPGQQRLLRSVQRDVLARPDALLGVLFNGPSQGELNARLVTAIPSGTTLLSTRSAGNVLFVDVSEEITELTGEALTLAVAQIVFTASEVLGVQVVRLRVNGEDQAWPKGDGQARQGDLRVFDYPGFAESAQPAFPAVPSLS